MKVFSPNAVLQISQIAVYSTSGINLALGGTATASTTWDRPIGDTCVQSAAGAIDGKLLAKDFTLCTSSSFGVYHSARNDGDWWLLDLGASYDVSRIVYYNRADNGWNTRAIGYIIEGLDAQSNIVASTTISSSAYVQQFQASTGIIESEPGKYYILLT